MKRSFMATGRKVLASALSAAMVVAFAPTVAFAGDPVASAENGQSTAVGKTRIAPTPVATAQGLNQAISNTTGDIALELSEDITLDDTLDLAMPGRSLVLDLGGHTLSGRVNLKGGALTLRNGKVEGNQPLNVYGSSDSSSTNYSVLNIEAGVTVNNRGDDKNSVVIFGNEYNTNGYGAVANIAGTVYGTVFVSGNLGHNNGYSDAMRDSNVVNVESGASIYTEADQAIAMNGAAVVNIEDGATVQGREAVGIKRGKLNVTGGKLVATGAKVDPVEANNNGTEASGAALSVTSTYNAFGTIDVNIAGGSFSSTHNGAIYKGRSSNNGSLVEFKTEPTISITGGAFSSDVTAYKASGCNMYKMMDGTFIVATGYPSHTSGNAWSTADENGVITEIYVAPAPVTPPAPPAEVGESTSGVELPSTPGDSGATAGSTKVDVTVTDTTAATDSKGNKVDGSVSIDKIETTSASVAIPETITTDKGTFLVTSIPAGAMEGNATATTVAIPESVTAIGEGAFSNCTALTTVTVPAGVTEIAFGTFAGCTSLETVEIQGEVTQIASNAFSGCESLTEVSIPETVTTIGSGAFSGCSSLTSASIPAGVATIEPNTFAGCTSLSTVEVAGELTEIAADAFNGCESLTSMTVAGTVRPLAAITRAASSALVIPASVTKIGDRAFKGTGITSVTVPAGVKMGTGVFRDCKQLTKATVASKVKAISAYTFKGCSALKSVTIPGTVTKIERSAFSGCKSLAKVTIPKGVTSIGKNALYGASKVKTLTVNSKKLTKSSVKGALAGSKVATVKVPKSMLKSYAKVFAKSVVGKTVKVRAI